MKVSNVLDPPMAKKKKGRPPSERDDAVARIDRTILLRAQMVAKDREISVAEFLSELVRGPVDAAYLELVKRLSPETDQGEK